MPQKTKAQRYAPYLKKLGVRLKQLREERGLSQSQLADAVDVERNHIYRIEAGKTNPTIGLMRDLAGALGMSLAEFCSDL
jgi:transcriptional regulator with XRE-family HTH domain